MNKIGQIICKYYILILIICLILIMPALVGMFKTKINYDILVYLPEDIETVKGEKILTDDFHMGAYATLIIENMKDQDIIKLEKKIKKVDGVNKVISIDDVTGSSVPLDTLPSEIVEKVAKDNSRLVLVTFEQSTSSDETLAAVEQLRKLVNKQSKVGGMSTMVLDTKDIFNSEMTLYVVIAVILCIVVLMFSLDSYVVPFLLILNIGIAILYNMGTNIFLGNISYITKAISSVLQLGVTTDFSIFLYHKYEKFKKDKKDSKEAMSLAIHDTLISVFGSSLTTIAGFLALCTMNLTLGMDIGIVMAKGVVFGLICVITIFPSLLLLFDRMIEKTKHRQLIPKFSFIKQFVLNHYKIIFIIFLVLLIPAYQAQRKTENYYKLDESIPDNYGYSMASKALREDYGIVSQEIILVSRSLNTASVNMMIDDIKKIDGIDLVLGGSMISKYGLDESLFSKDIKNIYESKKYQMIMINSKYDIATDELNNQITKINRVVRKYDKKAIVAGEGPLMKDLIKTTDTDFKNVNVTSIIVIFILMLIVLRSISLPVLLVGAIELAIFINMGIPYFKGTEIPFISSVVIGTIQLGATIDYAILMTTKYLQVRKTTTDKKEAVSLALDSSLSSIFVSGMCFFAATIGVALVSKIDLIGSLCTLISRGAIISMLVVMTIVPSLLLIFDSVIVKTTLGFKKGKIKMNKKLAMLILLISLLITVPVNALTKDETVYVKLKSSGEIKKISVVDHLINEDKLNSIIDYTDLQDIENTSGKEKYKLKNDQLIWNANGKNIYYKGTSHKELPVSMNITYQLDGKDMKTSKMLGKKGHVEITIKYQNRDKHVVRGNELYTPFVIATTTILNGDNASNIKVTNGKVLSNGQNYIVASLSTPGLYESLSIDELKDMDTVIISYDTDKFELSSIYAAATSKVVDSIDLSKINSLDSIYQSISTLDQSSKQLVEGTKAINEGTTKINSGVTEAIDKLKNNQETIDDETLTMIKEIASNKAIEEIKANKDQIMNQAIQSLMEMENKNGQIKQSSDNKVDQNDSLIDALKLETYKQLGFTEDQVNQIKNDCLADMNYCAQKEIIESYENSAINQAKQLFYENALELAQNIAANTAYNTALQVASEVSSETSQVVAQSVFDQVKTNIIGKVVLSLDELKKGLDILNQGTSDLENGMSQFDNQGINKITNIVNNKIKPSVSKVKDLRSLAHQYNIFTKTDNDSSSSIKFIYIVDGVKVKEKEIKTTKKTKSSFIDRVTNLFK